MSPLTFFQWIETTSLSTAIREGALYYPILGAFHLIGIAWFGGMVLMSDVKAFGLGLRNESAPELMAQFRRSKWVGFFVMLISGGLLWWSEPLVCYKSASFRIKVALLLLAGLNEFVFRRAGRRMRLTACVSIVLWVGLIFTGRGIAFF